MALPQKRKRGEKKEMQLVETKTVSYHLYRSRGAGLINGLAVRLRKEKSVESWHQSIREG